ncbi:ATP-dependent dethiobiotin synthetase BioD [Tsuneonella flava]|uniref:ATP-dependent dethiobiotin synthetase BioD n=1 Tax=Tsuneonella flava TaxID=2055955 RepID=A0ABX7KBC8_9SPHN|nr:dethiobiotin synthase [Tsuneonella flava]QSB45287.1 ATP-dependent dethiobiotin synthetase BioD [Tsuneonella flava]
MHRVIVVTGTDTDVGKTVFAAGLAAAIGAHYWKPVQAGLEDGTDTATASKLGVPAQRIVPEAYRLATPCSPHRAAEIDGVQIDLMRLALPDVEGTLVVEGAGGALVPVTRETLYADVFARWGQPTIVVARTGLGTINHTLLTIEALRARGVPILGIAFVGPAEDDSEATICEMGNVPRLGRLPHLASLDPDSLQAAILSGFDMEFFR